MYFSDTWRVRGLALPLFSSAQGLERRRSHPVGGKARSTTCLSPSRATRLLQAEG